MLHQPIQFIYASTSGHTEAVIEFIADLWRQTGVETAIMRAEAASPNVLTEHRLFVLGISTWQHGDANPYFRPLMSAMKEIDLSGKYAAFVGLGDKRYEPVLFNYGLDLLKQRWWDGGGKEIGEDLRINGEPFAKLETEVADWANQTLALFKNLDLDAVSTSQKTEQKGTS